MLGSDSMIMWPPKFGYTSRRRGRSVRQIAPASHDHEEVSRRVYDPHRTLVNGSVRSVFGGWRHVAEPEIKARTMSATPPDENYYARFPASSKLSLVLTASMLFLDLTASDYVARPLMHTMFEFT